MFICCACSEPLEFGSRGAFIKLITAIRSPKSGRPIPGHENFPDGDQEKYVCMECIPYELQVAIGLNAPGYDIPNFGEDINDPMRRL